MSWTIVTSCLVAWLCCWAPVTNAAAIAKSPFSAYAPINGSCPSTPLVRPGKTLSTSETQYVLQRNTAAKKALASWFTRINPAFSTTHLPTVGMATSGGGYRSLLTGAGVIQGFDARDSNATVRGLYQGITYHTGLSGGAWLLSSLMGNNWPTVSTLRDTLWGPAFAQGLLNTDQFLSYLSITYEIVSKNNAGWTPTLIDVWGRLLSYQLLQGPNGGVSTTLSSITRKSNFTDHQVPYPILTAIGIPQGSCIPGNDGTQYELTPYEFGSWDQGVNAFTSTQYLGTKMSGGVPTGQCTTNYDNLGYVLGTSSALFNVPFCPAAEGVFGNDTFVLSADMLQGLTELMSSVHTFTDRDVFAPYPNSFFQDSSAPLVSADSEINLVDGAESSQNNPIWPYLQPQRNVDAVIVNDNSGLTNSYPNGAQLYQTYMQSQVAGLHRMPPIPSPTQYLALGLNKQPTFFGCNNASTLTIIYLPNAQYTYPSDTSTFKIQYSQQETNGMIANGAQIASKGGDEEWPTCLACGLMTKQNTKLPDACQACLKQYCYN